MRFLSITSIYDRMDAIKRLFDAAGLSILTASITLLVVAVSAAGSNVEEFRNYNSGYFVGTFLAMALYPQFSFYVIQYASSGVERLEMLLVSILIVSVAIFFTLYFYLFYLRGLFGLGLLSGVIYNSSIYLNTEVFSNALRQQSLKSFFLVRIIAVFVPFALWTAVIVFYGAKIEALLFFEITRGLVLFVFVGIAFHRLVKNNRFPSINLPAGIVRAMLPRHLIKICEALLIALLPFFVMRSTDDTVAPIRVGFQVGLTLAGIVGIVLVPRVLRSYRLQGTSDCFVHWISLAITFFAIIIILVWYNIHENSLLALLIGVVLAVFLPAISLSGAFVLRFRGAGPVAVVWVVAALLSLLFVAWSKTTIMHLLVGLLAVSVGYSVIVLFVGRPNGRLPPE